MRQWYYAAIANVSVHEVYPGHYIQFLYAQVFPSDVRKVFGATTNVEGWAHYAEADDDRRGLPRRRARATAWRSCRTPCSATSASSSASSCTRRG